jgi:hypothetical protein
VHLVGRVVREAEPGEIEDFGAPGMMAVTALGSGQLVHAPGWTVDRLEVLRARDHKRVWALALSSDDADEGQWVRLTWRPTGVGAIWDPPKDRMTFDEWADVIWAEAQGKEVPAALLVDDRVEPGPGVIVLEAILHPEEAAAFGPVQDRAAALLELRDGTRVYALVTRSGSTVVDPAELPEDTLAGFLAHLESVGESGGDL